MKLLFFISLFLCASCGKIPDSSETSITVHCAEEMAAVVKSTEGLLRVEYAKGNIFIVYPKQVFVFTVKNDDCAWYSIKTN